MVVRKAPDQNCSRTPDEVLPILVDASEPLNNGVNNNNNTNMMLDSDDNIFLSPAFSITLVTHSTAAALSRIS